MIIIKKEKIKDEYFLIINSVPGEKNLELNSINKNAIKAIEEIIFSIFEIIEKDFIFIDCEKNIYKPMKYEKRTQSNRMDKILLNSFQRKS